MSKPVDGLMAEFVALVPKEFFPCNMGCGVQIGRRGACWDCEAIGHRTTEAQDRYESSKAALPKGYVVSLDGPELRARGVNDLHIAKARDSLGSKRVVIAGAKSGSGKSSLLAAMFLGWLRRNTKPAVWLSAFTVSDTMHMRSEWDDAELIALDDLGSERQMASSLIPTLLESRYSQNKALWLTTPMSHAEVMARYGANNARRVFHGVALIDLGAR